MSGQGGWTSSHRMTACGPGTGLKIVLERHATHALLEGSSACAGCVIAPGSVNHGREPRGRDSGVRCGGVGAVTRNLGDRLCW